MGGKIGGLNLLRLVMFAKYKGCKCDSYMRFYCFQVLYFSMKTRFNLPAHNLLLVYGTL